VTPLTRTVRTPGRARRTTVLVALVAALAAALVSAVGSPASAAVAAAAPATPTFGPLIEPLAGYDGAKTCPPKVTQPGIAKLETLLTATYGKTSFGTWRACSGTVATSEHNEGRALDFMLDSSNAGDVAIANSFAAWLFATDAQGNAYANARRLGIMYIIWHGKMWRAYDVAEGWQPYTGAENHYDHMHISLSWPGALATTSFWNTAASYPPGPPTPEGVPAQLLTAGSRVVDGKQWSTSCVPYGTAGGRRCIASVYEPIVTSHGHGWVVENAWVRDSVNYLDFDAPAWSTALVAVPGTQTWAGSQYATTCTPSASSGARVCATTVLTSTVSQSGTSFVRANVWVPYANAWLVAAASS
jgi:hypothetical protein